MLLFQEVTGKVLLVERASDSCEVLENKEMGHFVRAPLCQPDLLLSAAFIAQTGKLWGGWNNFWLE